MKYDLSILIPARNEIFLAKTIEDILSNSCERTEIIVVLDGQWAEPGIPMHPRVTVVYLPESIGQRAATNLACCLSSAKYIIKTDAHCAFDKGFDEILMADMQDDWTMVPTMKNLHAFDWVCPNGHRRYQGPSGPCITCGEATERDVVWIAKRSPNSNAYMFDTALHFQYHKEWDKKQEGDLTDSMSIQGSFFMLTREKYWELNICDENFGSWGQQGVEVACKTWLSGGRVVINRKTWYAHMFRTQGGDFSFPYPLSEKDVDKARQYSRDLFLNGKFDKAIHSFHWLIEKFSPLPFWHDKTKAIVYYTDNDLDEKIMKACQEKLLEHCIPIISVSLKPIDFGHNIVLPLERGYLTMAKQILEGLEASTADIVFLCEHDVLYHSSHFDFVPPKNDRYFYNTNVWKFDPSKDYALRVDDCRQLSGLCAYRNTLIEHFKERVRRIESEGFSRKMGFEPGTHNRKERIDMLKSEKWESEYPNIDIRHDKNLTSSRWSKKDFRDQKYTKGWTESKEVPGWGDITDIRKSV